MKYKEYKSFDYPAVAREVMKKWESEDIFKRSVSERSDSRPFTFFEGPPSANGTPGIHHVMARTVKDIFCRYKTMQGYQVKRKGGWDTHGLPVELQVEKELGIKKDDIGKKISVAEYNQRCREAVMKYKDEWDDLTRKMGYWVDLDDPYITFETPYIETLWHLLKKLYDKGLLYKGYTIQPYSPKAGTGLSSHELNQPGTYKDVKDTSITAQFKIQGEEKSYLLAWTTTPWTLPSNTALAVGKNIDYVRVKTYNQYTYEPVEVILAKDRMSAYFSEKVKDMPLSDYKPGDKKIPFEVIQEMKGSELEGMTYEQLLPYVTPEKPAFRVIIGDYVTTEDGTGIVHIAPTFGADDARVAAQNDIPAILVKDDSGNEGPLVDREGRFVKEVTDFAGKYVKEAYETQEVLDDPDYKSTDVLIAIKLKEENKAFRVEKYEHSYPHCWRTDKPVLYYPMESWFIRTTALKDKLVELNKTINWKPQSTGTGRFGNWLENLVDWNLSRSRFWGTPLPIWRTEDGQEEVCIGSIQELRDAVKNAVAAGVMASELDDEIDLHRPYVDDIVLVSPSGKKMYREPDLIDVWFDSGAMPYAQWHYPFENEETFQANFPADFIAEGVDQTRGWFFTLHALSVVLFDSVAYKNVIANGLVLDKNGNKMSKRLGNAVNPFDTIDTYGPDATRWYMISNANPWDNLKFNEEGISEVQRRFFSTLYNTYSFFALYANLDEFDHADCPMDNATLTESDEWILSRLNTLIDQVTRAYDDYEPTKATRLIMDFTSDDLSNWYVRLNRKRYWRNRKGLNEKELQNKWNAYHTLYECLITVAQLSAPVAPFYMDRLYQDLTAHKTSDIHDSVHLSSFPKAVDSRINKELEETMGIAQKITTLVHSLRRASKLKVRLPLAKILVPVTKDSDRSKIEHVGGVIKSEVNIKEIEIVDDTSDILVKSIKPNFRSLGQKYGPLMKAITAQINAFGSKEIAQIETEGRLTIEVDGKEIELLPDDVEIINKDIPGWMVASEGKWTVALDVTVTDELLHEGIARDLVNRIQNLRKDNGYEVQDKINIQIKKQAGPLEDALSKHSDYICHETQALKLELVQSLENGNEFEIDDINVLLSIEKVQNVNA